MIDNLGHLLKKKKYSHSMHYCIGGLLYQGIRNLKSIKKYLHFANTVTASTWVYIPQTGSKTNLWMKKFQLITSILYHQITSVSRKGWSKSTGHGRQERRKRSSSEPGRPITALNREGWHFGYWYFSFSRDLIGWWFCSIPVSSVSHKLPHSLRYFTQITYGVCLARGSNHA